MSTHNAFLVINAGSSSLKFSVFRQRTGTALDLAVTGQIAGIDVQPTFQARDAAGELMADRCWPPEENPDRPQLLRFLLDWLHGAMPDCRLAAAGHRVIHGGSRFAAPVQVTDDILAELDQLVPLAPLHQPHNLLAMRALAEACPALPQVACFDTAFHHFGVPRGLSEHGMRRYGFHGLSYEYVARHLRNIAPDLARGRVVVAHLGNGASLCAMHDGKSMDATMGFPGLSGVSNDMRMLLESGEGRAQETVDLFCFRVAKDISALATSLGGIDALVFTAGIGEHSAPVRQAVCGHLAWLGLRMDPAANAAKVRCISTPDSSVAVLVIPADEERMIATHTQAVLKQAA